jgi:hypothetical protein
MPSDVAHAIVVMSFMNISSHVAHVNMVTSYIDMSSDVAHVIVVTSYIDMSSDVAHAIVVMSYMDISSDVAHGRESDHVQNCPPFCFPVLEVGDFDQLEFENKRVFTIFFI